MAKDKWINIRCTEEQREDVTELAKKCNMAVSELFWYFVANERKEKTRADMVEVVRCKDCKFYKVGNPNADYCYHERHEHLGQGVSYNPDDFCRYGTPQNDEVRE